VITAELASLVAATFNGYAPSEGFAAQPAFERERILAIAKAVQDAERTKSRATLQALAACVDDGLKEAM
jgi:hypothetical protein